MPETVTVGFRVTPSEREQLDKDAAKANLSLTEYIKSKVIKQDVSSESSPPKPKQPASCRDPKHSYVFGSGHCFFCDLPIFVPQQ